MRRRLFVSAAALVPWLVGSLVVGFRGPTSAAASAAIVPSTTSTTSTTVAPPPPPPTTVPAPAPVEPPPSPPAPRASRGGHRSPLVTAPIEVVLACLRGPWKGAPQESNGRYDAVSASGKYHGAYQFEQGTWNGVVYRLGWSDLIDVDPATVAPEIQDAAAAQLVRERGVQPWPRRDECATATP
ncbi:MAG TPA: transglycosylase family protein [Acidimicrobiales bacterium]|nr:transglycosylase family protein [Acidimicrobiales bacterium]